MEKLIIIILTVLPSLLLWKYINKIDKQKEPLGVLIKLFIGGILSTIIALILTFILDIFWPSIIDYKINYDIQGFLYVFFYIGLVEEVSKFLVICSIGWHNNNMDETYDVILYAMMVALGFATFENILYSLSGGIITSFFRFFTAVPGHVINGAFMGYFLCKYRISFKKKYLLLGLIIPSLAHGIYDFLAFTAKYVLDVIIFAIYVIFEFVFAKKLVRKMADESKNLDFPFIKCKNCGQVINSRYCPNCGRERA